MKPIILSVLLFFYTQSISYSQIVNTNLKIDSLNTQLENTNDSKKRVDILNNLSILSLEKSIIEAEKFNQQALTESHSIGYSSGLQSAYYSRSLILFSKGDFDLAKVSCNEAINLAEKNSDILLIASYHNRLGSIEQRTGNYEKALQSYLVAMHYFDSLDNTKGMAATANKIGIFYESRSEFKNALEYYNRALKYYEKIGNQHQQAVVLNNIGVVHFETKNYKKALSFYELSLEMLKILGDQSRISIREINIGKVHKELGDHNLAHDYFLSGYQAAKEQNNKNLLFYTLNQLGENMLDQKRNNEAIQYFNEAISLSNLHGDKEVLLDLYSNLTQAFLNEKNHKEAYKHSLNYWQLKDSIQNVEVNSQLAEVKAKYESVENEKAIALLTKEGEKKDIILYAVLGGTILMIAITLLIITNQVRKNKASKVINEKNEELNRQKISELLREQQLRSVQAKLEGQEIERKRIAKDLHDGIGGTLASIKLSLMKDDSEQMKSIIQSLDQACEEVRAVSHNLVPPVLFDSTFTDVIRDFVNKTFRNQNTAVILDFFPELHLNEINKNLQIDVYRIIQELTTNISKHAFATNVDMSITLHDDFINIIIEDNGRGFDFEEKRKGIGLKNIASRVNILDGTLEIDTKIGRGTVVNVDIPSLLEDVILENQEI